MPLKSLALCLLIAVLPGYLFAQSLRPEEAQQILKKAQRAERVLGSFKSVLSSPTKKGTQTTTTLSKTFPDGHTLFHRVTVTTVTDKPEKTRSKLLVRNEEGQWEVHDHYAILVPQMINQERMQELADKARESAAAGDKDALRKAIAADPFIAQGLEIWKHTHFTGERLTVDSQPRVRIVRTLDEEGQKVMLKMVKEQMAEAKKQLPFAMRLLATPVLAMIDIGAKLPARHEYLIDEAAPKIIEKKSYNGEGKQLPSARDAVRESIPDLPSSTFELPSGLELHRPKTFGEYVKLQIKLEKSKDKEHSTGGAAEAD